MQRNLLLRLELKYLIPPCHPNCNSMMRNHIPSRIIQKGSLISSKINHLQRRMTPISLGKSLRRHKSRWLKPMFPNTKCSLKALPLLLSIKWMPPLPILSMQLDLIFPIFLESKLSQSNSEMKIHKSAKEFLNFSYYGKVLWGTSRLKFSLVPTPSIY